MRAKQPNVLFILSDQHNAKCLGHKDHPDVKTPNLDRLAEEGVRFDNCITQNCICTPSRVSFLSGQYCHNHGYYGLSGPNPNGLPTVLGHFRRHGYTTAAIGKIHCPEYWIEDDSDCFHETCACSIGGRSREYAQYLEERGLTDLEDHGMLSEFGDRGRQTVEGRASKVSFEDGQEGWVVNKCIEFMEQAREAETPFIAHVSLPKPHQCYTPAQEFWDLYEEDTLTLPPNADHEDPHMAPHLKQTAERWRRGEWTLFEPHGFEAGRRRKLRGYLGNVSHVDHAVGLLTQWLDENGLGEETIVVYSSDHGDYAAEHGIMEKAPGICHDAITRIPFLWRWTGRTRAGHVVEDLAEAVDVVPTLCALCDLPALETADGKDLSPLLRGEGGPVRDVAVTEFAWSRSLRKGDWRLVWYPQAMFPEEYPEGFGELYNLAEDPWEMRNRFFDPECRQTVQELRADLLDWLVRTTRPTTVHPVDPPPSPQTVTRYHHRIHADGKMSPDAIRRFPGRNYI
jgi:choline-sulfatase/uncharacterized sulfatase